LVDYPALEQFAGGYLHQDWRLDYDNAWEALDDFIDGQPELVTPLSRELKSLLAKQLTDEELAGVLVTHGADHIPRGTDGTAKGWLQEVAARVSSI
jgi:hypothetical protein